MFFVSHLATVIVIRYNCNKDELEPWTILGLFAIIDAVEENIGAAAKNKEYQNVS